ncbi:MAG: isoprenylcysteine carboxylmethyltransferase family protein [Nitrospirota bacterium]
MDYFTFGYLFFIIGSMIYRLIRLTKSYSVEPKHGKVEAPLSYPILLCLYLLIFIISIIEYFYCRFIIQIREINLIVSGIGVLMYVGVIPLRAIAIQFLGKHISPDVKITEDHKLIKEGPYKYLRHPLALCVIIEVLGITLIPNSYYSFLIALFIFLPYMIFRTYLEEKALIDKFGQEYLDYKKQVYAFLPVKKRTSK